VTPFVVGLLVVGAVAGPTWLDLAARRRVVARLDRSSHAAMAAERPRRARGGAIAGATRHLAAVGRPVRRTVGRPADAVADAAVGAAVVLGAVSAVVAGPAAALLVVAVVVIGPPVRTRTTRRRAEREVRRSLPDVVDLFRLAAGAGLSVHQAVAAVAERAPEPVGPVLRLAARRAGMGERLGEALDALDVLGDPVRPLRAALTSAARYGAPLGPTLERVGEDARMLRRREAEERARRLPVQLLFPLVVCVLPAFGLLAVVPLLAGSLPALSDVR
jgi:tight adherence protein C